jgi:F5/8 type C domain
MPAALGVVTVAAGGLPVVISANGRGLPVTEVTGSAKLGLAVTQVTLPKGGMPVVYVLAAAAAGPLLSPNNMTANNLPAPYVALASNEYANPTFAAFQAFAPTGDWSTTGISLPQWIQIDLGTAKTVASYSMTTRSDGLFRQWIDWTLSGGPDGVAWTMVDTRTGVATVGAGVMRLFTLSTPQTYRYWRWTVTASGFDGFGADVGELALYGP